MNQHLKLIAILCIILRCSFANGADVEKARLADLNVLQRDYVDRSPAFDASARKAAHDLIASLRKEAAAMSPAQFVLAVSKVAALADNGHDTIDLGEGGWSPTTRLPVRLIWFPDALIIARAASDKDPLLGASILSIDGTLTQQILERIRPLQGGTDSYRRWDLTWILQSPEVLYALGIAQRLDQITVRLRMPNGRAIQRILPALPVAQTPGGQNPSRYWIPAPWDDEKKFGWRSAIKQEKVPLYLKDPDELFRLVPLPEVDALYLQFRSNFDEGGKQIAPFVASVSERLKTSPPKNMIVDLRFDTGGDNTQNRALMKQIAETVAGKIYLLVSNYTFSAGIASAAALKHDGGSKVVIAGSEVGDRMHWWSEGQKRVCLPNSKICVHINTGFWDLVNGCKGIPACYSDQFNLTVPSLEPDIQTPLTSDDWLNYRDPAMNAVLKELRQQQPG